MMEDYTKTMGTHDLVTDTVNLMMEAYDELDGAKKYIKSAIQNKNVERKMADSLVVMSAQELGHYDMIVAGIESMMAKIKAEQHECYDVVYKMWKHIKERQAGYAAWIKQLHADYKTMA